MTQPVTIAIEDTPNEVSNRCESFAQLLHFYLHASDMIGFLRTYVSDENHMDDPVQFCAMVSVLDDALNGRRKDETKLAIDFIETLGCAFFRETAVFKEAHHVD